MTKDVPDYGLVVGNPGRPKGGMCTTSDPDLAEKLKVLTLHGGKPKYYHSLGWWQTSVLMRCRRQYYWQSSNIWISGRPVVSRTRSTTIAAARSVLSIPIYPELTPAQQEYVVNAIGDYVKRSA